MIIRDDKNIVHSVGAETSSWWLFPFHERTLILVDSDFKVWPALGLQ